MSHYYTLPSYQLLIESPPTPTSRGKKSSDRPSQHRPTEGSEKHRHTHGSSRTQEDTLGLGGGGLRESVRCADNTSTKIRFINILLVLLNAILGLLFMCKARQTPDWCGSVRMGLARFIGAGLVMSSLGGVACGTAFIFASLMIKIISLLIGGAGAVKPSSSRGGGARSSTRQFGVQYDNWSVQQGKTPVTDGGDGGKPPSKTFPPFGYILKLLWQQAVIGWLMTMLIGLIAIKVGILFLVA